MYLKVLLRLIFVILAIVAIFMVIGSLFARDYEFSVSTSIKSDPAGVFEWINTIENWQHWSAWDPSRIEGLTVQYSGEPSGEGAIQTWKEQRGDGKLWITGSEAFTNVNYSMRFLNFPQQDGQFLLSRVGAETLVTWQGSGEMPPGPFYGWFANVFRQTYSAECQRTLDRLKAVVEGKVGVAEEPPAAAGSPSQ